LLGYEIVEKINVIGSNSIINLYFENVADGSKVENTNGTVFVKLTNPAKAVITAKSVKVNGEAAELIDGTLEHEYSDGTNVITIVNTNGKVEIEE